MRSCYRVVFYLSFYFLGGCYKVVLFIFLVFVGMGFFICFFFLEIVGDFEIFWLEFRVGFLVIECFFVYVFYYLVFRFGLVLWDKGYK